MKEDLRGEQGGGSAIFWNDPWSCQELHSRGFTGVGRMVVHVAEGPAVYDSRKLPSKRNYLKCVLAQSTLFGGGCRLFKSNGPQSYYAMLLKDPLTEPGLKAIKYDEQLKKLTGNADPPELKQIVPAPGRGAVSPGDPDIDGGEIEPPPPPPPLPVEDDGWGSSADSRASSSAAAASDHGEDDEVDGEDVADPYPDEINGQLLKRETHSGRGDSGLRVSCQNPEHDQCTCYRSTKLWTTDFGVDAPVLFLKTWMSRSFSMNAANHRKWRPGKKDIRLFVLSEIDG